MKFRWAIALVLVTAEHWAFWELATGIRHREILESYRWLLIFWFLLPPLSAAIILAPWRYQIVATTCNGPIAALLHHSVSFYQPAHLKDSLTLNMAGLLTILLIAGTIGAYIRVISLGLDSSLESRLSHRAWIAISKSLRFSLICLCFAVPVALVIGPGIPTSWPRMIQIAALISTCGLSIGLLVGLLVGLTYRLSPDSTEETAEVTETGPLY